MSTTEHAFWMNTDICRSDQYEDQEDNEKDLEPVLC